MKRIFFVLAITAVVSSEGQPPNISPKHMKVSEDFYPETSRDVIFDPFQNTIPNDEIQRRSAHSPVYSVEGESLAKILLALRYLHLIRPNSTQHQDSANPGSDYSAKISKLFYVIQKTAQNAVEKATKHRRNFAEKRQFCENLRNVAKKLEVDFASKEAYEKIYIIKSKMSRGIQETVDRAAEMLLHATGESTVYKFAAIEKMSEFAVILLHSIQTDSQTAARDMCASFYQKTGTDS